MVKTINNTNNVECPKHNLFFNKRRLRDSNPRYRFQYFGFQDRRIRPLCQTSVGDYFTPVATESTFVESTATTVVSTDTAVESLLASVEAPLPPQATNVVATNNANKNLFKLVFFSFKI